MSKCCLCHKKITGKDYGYWRQSTGDGVRTFGGDPKWLRFCLRCRVVQTLLSIAIIVIPIGVLAAIIIYALSIKR
jgi:hypothetical protein